MCQKNWIRYSKKDNKMNPESRKYINDLYRGVDDYIRARNSFACVYGSAVTGQNTQHSDIDFFVALENKGPAEIAALVKFAEKFHQDRGLGIDEEVPYQNKVCVSFSEMHAAANLQGLALQDNRILVPPVIKTNQFLSSVEVKLRLIFNALTVPHDVSRETAEYISAREKSERSLFLLAVDLAERKGLNVDKVSNLVDVLLADSDGIDGESYLGYKPSEPVIRRLEAILQNQLEQFHLTDSLLIHAVLNMIPNLFEKT